MFTLFDIGIARPLASRRVRSLSLAAGEWRGEGGRMFKTQGFCCQTTCHVMEHVKKKPLVSCGEKENLAEMTMSFV